MAIDRKHFRPWLLVLLLLAMVYGVFTNAMYASGVVLYFMVFGDNMPPGTGVYPIPLAVIIALVVTYWLYRCLQRGNPPSQKARRLLIAKQSATRAAWQSCGPSPLVLVRAEWFCWPVMVS